MSDRLPCGPSVPGNEEVVMGIGDKAEELKGKVKAAVGDATDDRSMEAEGKAEEFSGKAKQETESVVDALRGAGTAMKGDPDVDRDPAVDSNRDV